ncbi:MAG: hypothetical protein R3320_10540 [Nitriliruptorales bacterium]|nr:hypothetical protein [Nitriliruptorales bacterium]
MPLIRTWCPTCQRSIDVVPDSMVLLPGSEERMARVLFACPTCDEGSSFHVDAQLATLLVAGGARVSHHPSLQRPGFHGDAPPLTYDDLLAFHELLQRPDWFEELIAPG